MDSSHSLHRGLAVVRRVWGGRTWHIDRRRPDAAAGEACYSRQPTVPSGSDRRTRPAGRATAGLHAGEVLQPQDLDRLGLIMSDLAPFGKSRRSSWAFDCRSVADASKRRRQLPVVRDPETLANSVRQGVGVACGTTETLGHKSGNALSITASLHSRDSTGQSCWILRRSQGRQAATAVSSGAVLPNNPRLRRKLAMRAGNNSLFQRQVMAMTGRSRLLSPVENGGAFRGKMAARGLRGLKGWAPGGPGNEIGQWQWLA